MAKTILIVDDSSSLRMVVKLALNRAGYDVLEAGDGKEGLAQLEKAGKVHLIVSDVNMPVLDGLEATRAIRRQQGPTPPIVAMTANALVSDRRACHAAGMTGFISKPMEMEQLALAIERACAENAGAVSLSRFGALV